MTGEEVRENKEQDTGTRREGGREGGDKQVRAEMMNGDGQSR